MSDEYRPFTIYTVVLLAVGVVVCAQCARLAGRGVRTTWTVLAIGFAFLALDDLTQIHEGLDPKAKLPDLLDAGFVKAGR
jgi:hypothetical protein